jgi:hypothetical protein
MNNNNKLAMNKLAMNKRGETNYNSYGSKHLNGCQFSEENFENISEI